MKILNGAILGGFLAVAVALALSDGDVNVAAFSVVRNVAVVPEVVSDVWAVVMGQARPVTSPDYRAVKRILGLMDWLQPFDPKQTPEDRRAIEVETMSRVFGSDETFLRPVRGAPVPMYRLSPASSRDADPGGLKRLNRAVLYFHGGGFVTGSAVSHAKMFKRVIDRVGMDFYFVEYSKAPENQMTKIVTEAVEAYKHLTGPMGIHPRNLIVAGDSAGGNLAGLLLVKLASIGPAVKMPCAAWLISPWVDLVDKGQGTHCPIISPTKLAWFQNHVKTAALGKPLSFSMITHDVNSFPPVLLHNGGEDILAKHIRAFHEKLIQGRITSHYHEVPGLCHCFPLLPLPEADMAIDQFIEFAGKVCGK